MRGLAVVVGVLGIGTYAAPAVAAATPKPVVVSVAASPAKLSADGGSVRVTARVRNATTCTFRHQAAPSASLRKDAVVRCSSGRASATIRLGANQSLQALALRIDVQAVRGSKSAHRAVTVTQAAAPGPLAIGTTALNGTSVGTAYSVPLAASGGKPPYTWTVSDGFLPVGLTLDAGGTIAGTPTSSGRFPVTVQVTDAAGQTATAALSLAVTPVLRPVGSLAFSSNWSGYALEGGSFTFAMGTFTVPNNTAASGVTDDSEWVGIDGFANSNLIQAGVAEDTGADGSRETYAWWEILPAAATPIPSMNVSPGDTVTVILRQLAAGSWLIEVDDVTKNQSFSTTQAYSGPGTSAEWIVEAATDLRSNQVVTIGPYSPPVTFTDVGWSGAPNGGFTPIELKQGSAVSVPSSWNATQTGFAVGYGAAPSPPA